jgi:dipeptide/tripeptide permease
MGKEQKTKLSEFPLTYWVVIVFEFFERGAYYGVMSILSVYMTDILGFSKLEAGAIKGTIQPLLYFLPILSGAIADRLGYRKMLMTAFTLLGIGYLLASQTTEYAAVFISLVIMGFGAGFFKPIISGTIAKVTTEKTSSLGFGVFYWSINLGAFIFPLVIVPWLKSIDWSYVLLMAGVVTSLMLIPTFFIYKEPAKEIVEEKSSLLNIFLGIGKKIVMVILDWRFILFIFIYSWFWILYFLMFDSVLWYFKDFVDATEFNVFLSKFLWFDFKFDIEHVTVINALTIIILQLFVSNIVKHTKALPTMVAGIALGTIGISIFAISTNIWVFLLGMVVFSLGEMTAHPKYISYLGLIAPEDKKATYMGFGFLYGFFGSFISSFLGAMLYVRFIDNPRIDFIRQKLTETGSGLSMPNNVTIADAMKIAEPFGLSKS